MSHFFFSLFVFKRGFGKLELASFSSHAFCTWLSNHPTEPSTVFRASKAVVRHIVYSHETPWNCDRVGGAYTVAVYDTPWILWSPWHLKMEIQSKRLKYPDRTLSQLYCRAFRSSEKSIDGFSRSKVVKVPVGFLLLRLDNQTWYLMISECPKFCCMFFFLF